MERYSRNRIYISDEEQERIKHVRILLGGAGIGSIIAECALRFGFENITIVDGDKVEESNLNRQNYVKTDIGKYKAETLCKRLLKINPDAEIKAINTFIIQENVREIISGHHIAINALDFKDRMPFEFDRICSEELIPVLHPYNFGWAGFLTIVKPKGYQLSEISPKPNGFELKVAEYVSRYGTFWNMPVPCGNRGFATSSTFHSFLDCSRTLCERHVQPLDWAKSQILSQFLFFVPNVRKRFLIATCNWSHKRELPQCS